ARSHSTSPGCSSAQRTRRQVLEIGCSTMLGLGLPGLLAQRVRAGEARIESSASSEPAGKQRAKSVLFIFLFGGPSQLDTFDMKPDAPAEYRSTFAPIATRTPGLEICEHLPRLAQQTDKLAVVRTMSCNPGFGDHRLAVHGLLGGIDELPAGAGLVASRRDWPALPAVVEYLRPRNDGLPNAVIVPNELIDPGTGSYPGQTAGLLGAKYDPYRVAQDPNDAKYRVDESLRMPQGLTVDRLGSKRSLLAAIDAQRAELSASAETGAYSSQQHEAFRVLTSGRLADALNLERESAATRDRYGRHQFGQTLLLARRMLEAEVSIIQANLSHHAFWDTHYNNFRGLSDLLPPLDRGVSALLEDLAASGRLDETLIVMMGEFGRTPKLVPPDGKLAHFTSPGRDHWMSCFWGAFAGAGVRGGQVIGKSDAVAAYPVTTPYTHADVGATVYRALGIDPATTLRDIQGRPLQLNRGARIDALYA
ncbi:MAG: DUF1501 domain-containing protein, partial [Planctomycetaceae bacterium]|nr:DUF1501 domain-containing protein [Planctomycetaceae bacterium]